MFAVTAARGAPSSEECVPTTPHFARKAPAARRDVAAAHNCAASGVDEHSLRGWRHTWLGSACANEGSGSVRSEVSRPQPPEKKKHSISVCMYRCVRQTSLIKALQHAKYNRQSCQDMVSLTIITKCSHFICYIWHK